METTIYKGFKISYNEEFDRWEGKDQTVDSDVDFSATDGLTGLKKRIDAYKKKTSPLKGVTCLVKPSWSASSADYKVVTITSVTDDGRIWVKHDGGGREKLWQNDGVYLDNKHNRDLVKRRASLHKEIEVINDAIEALEDTLEVLPLTTVKDN